MMNDYFSKEFKMYVAEELKNNKHLQMPLKNLNEHENDGNTIPSDVTEKVINLWNKMDTITPIPNAFQNDDKSNEISIKDESNEVSLNEMSCRECCRANGIGCGSGKENPTDENFVCDEIV